MSRSVEDRICARYVEFLEQGERKRRWSIFDDVDWNALDAEKADPDRGLTAETFCGVEMLLPDYVAAGMQLVRRDFGQAWFLATWGYEEARHGLALREYLLRSGLRSDAQLEVFRQQLLDHPWTLPFDSPRRMIAYGLLQESTTLLSYRKEQVAAEKAGMPVLASIYRWIGRDEAAHADFYAGLLRIQLEADAEGSLADLVYVMRHFEMPGRDQLPDYPARLAGMQSVGIDRRAFVADVWLRALERVGLRRADIAPALAGS